MELLIAHNPDPDSSLPLLLRVPLGGAGLVFATKGSWPRETALYCHPLPAHAWPAEALLRCGRKGWLDAAEARLRLRVRVR